MIVVCIATFLALRSAAGLTLVETSASLIDASHPQIATFGGDQAHLLRVVTPGDRLDQAVDADVLLADGEPVVMTWRRDPGDADLMELAIALVIDSAPCHLELRLRPRDGATPTFAAVGDVSTTALPIVIAPVLVRLNFASGVDPLTDVLLGAVDTSITFATVTPWSIDVSALAPGERFDLVLRAGPPGDFDDDDDIDRADFVGLHECLDTASDAIECAAYADFDANERIDLQDFAIFQRLFTGIDVAAACGM